MTPRILSLSCGRGRPLGARIFPKRFPGEMVVHCLLVETGESLVLVDSGLSEVELEAPRRLGIFARSLGLVRAPELSARRQIEALGLDPRDVRDIVLTHLDLDHTGGVADFPRARVHVSREALAAAHAPRKISERLRTRPGPWRNANFVEHDVPPLAMSGAGDALIDGGCEIRIAADVRVRLVGLPGHVRGHCGVVIESRERRVFHVGDAYYARSELETRGSWAFRQFKRGIDESLSEADHTRECISEFVRARPDVEVVSSHDPAEFAEAVGRAGPSALA